MTLLLPFVLVGPLLMLATAVVALAAHGPVGWVAAAGLVVGVVHTTRWAARAALRWWAGTKAPVRTPATGPSLPRGRPAPLG